MESRERGLRSEDKVQSRKRACLKQEKLAEGSRGVYVQYPSDGQRDRDEVMSPYVLTL